jgi:hypothetical protein
MGTTSSLGAVEPVIDVRVPRRTVPDGPGRASPRIWVTASGIEGGGSRTRMSWFDPTRAGTGGSSRPIRWLPPLPPPPPPPVRESKPSIFAPPSTSTRWSPKAPFEATACEAFSRTIDSATRPLPARPVLERVTLPPASSCALTQNTPFPNCAGRPGPPTFPLLPATRPAKASLSPASAM